MLHIKKITALALTLCTTVSLIPMTSLAAHYDEWVQKDDGKWYYYDRNGIKVKYDSMSRWVDGKGYEYFVLNSKGAQVTTKGWYTTNYSISDNYEKVKFTTKYYLKSDGSCTTGWKKIGEKWYCFGPDGKMIQGMTASFYEDGKTKLCLLGSDGKRITKKGWHKITCKFFDSMYGKIHTTKNWYYVKSDGTCASKVKKIGKKKYVFDQLGVMIENDTVSIRNTKTGEAEYYLADKNGVLVSKKGWHKVKNSYTENTGTYTSKHKGSFKVYVGSDGKLYHGLKRISGKIYYFNPSMAENYTYLDENGIKYFFGKSGYCTRTFNTKA